MTTATHRTVKTPTLAPSTPQNASGDGFHLTRRGRLVLRGLPLMLSVATLTVVAAFLGSVLLSPPAVSSEHAGPELQTLTVMPGDSLWSIATTVAPEEDPVSTITRIDELNGLEGRAPEPGEELFLPSAA